MSNFLWFLIKSLPVVIGCYLLASPQTVATPLSKSKVLSIQESSEIPKPNILLTQAAPEYAHPDEKKDKYSLEIIISIKPRI